MQKQYLVGNCDRSLEERDFFLVNASNGEEAIYRYVKLTGTKKDLFDTFAYERNVSLSFAEDFWFQTEEESAAYYQGVILVSDDSFQERVREFFADHHEYADLYLQHWYSEEEDTGIVFPQKMLDYMLFNSSWIDGITAIPLHEIVEI